MVPGLRWQQVPVAAAWESTGSGERRQSGHGWGSSQDCLVPAQAAMDNL